MTATFLDHILSNYLKTSAPVRLSKLLTAAAVLFILSTSSAQETEPIESTEERGYKVRPLRIGVKVGAPNLIGGNLEYVTPLLDHRLAVNLDYSIIKSDWLIPEDEQRVDTETTDLDFSYLEGGVNYYFLKSGKGLYAGANYGVIKFKGHTNLSDDGDEVGTIDVAHGSLNLKIGARLGGRFYFRPEIGYSFSSLPKTVDYEVTNRDGSTETGTFDFTKQVAPAEILFMGFIANIGLGFAF